MMKRITNNFKHFFKTNYLPMLIYGLFSEYKKVEFYSFFTILVERNKDAYLIMGRQGAALKAQNQKLILSINI
jgi:hypothetical protein